MTSYNRVDTTITCLKRLHSISIPSNIQLEVFLVDDGCTDHTGEIVREQFPEITVIDGNGELYWNGGTLLAYRYARATSPDFYLWLNDDTHLFPDALHRLIDTYARVQEKGHREPVVVGATREPTDQSFSYGGYRFESNGLRRSLVSTMPSDVPTVCDTFNGNCVLIPASIVRSFGMTDRRFPHAMADIDFGLRIGAAGASIWQTPGFIGVCAGHTFGRIKAPSWAKWKRFVSIKGLPPRQWFRFTRRHFGFLWFAYWLNPYLKFWIGKQ